MHTDVSATLLSDLPPRAKGAARAPVIAIVAEKGGVGKTTTASNLAAALGKSTPTQPGLRVLAIDAEPQGQLGLSLGADLDQDVEGTLADALACAERDQDTGAFANFEEHFADHPLTATSCENVLLLSGDEALVDARDQINGGGAKGELWMKIVTEFFAPFFDVIVIDTPPSVSGPLMLGALYAADLAVTPVHANVGFSIASLDKLATHVSQLGDDAPPLVPLATAVDPRLKKWREINDLVREEALDGGYLEQAAQLVASVVPAKRRQQGPWLAIVGQATELDTGSMKGEPIVVGRRSGSLPGIALREFAADAYTLATRQVEATR